MIETKDNNGSARTGQALEVELLQNGNGDRPMIATKNLDIAKLVTNEQRDDEEKFLAGSEDKVESGYRGLRRYGRLFEITRVIAMLSLYLYLDQLDIHQRQQVKNKKERLKRADRLTRLAVYGEKLYAVRLAFFQLVMKALRRFVIGTGTDRDRNQAKQAVWL
jgi:hypothetical protein